MKSLFFSLLMGCFFIFGIFISKKNAGNIWQQNKILSAAQRDPAAIKKNYDFSELIGPALDSAIKKRIISGLSIKSENSEIGIEFGHFVSKSISGEKKFACDLYSKIILVFQSENVISENEKMDKPNMEIEGDCHVSKMDVNKISSIWIPILKILEQPVADGEFDFRDNHPIKIRFSNVSGEWPSLWTLVSVKFLKNQSVKTNVVSAGGSISLLNGSDEMLIEKKELQALAEQPILVRFK